MKQILRTIALLITLSGVPAASASLPGLAQETFANAQLSGTPVLSVAENLDTIWQNDGIVSRRWTGFLRPGFSESYKLALNVNDRAKVWINDQLILNVGTEDDNVSNYWLVESNPVALQTNAPASIRVEYANDAADGRITLFWSSASQSLQPVPPSAFSHAPVSVAPPTVTLTTAFAAESTAPQEGPFSVQVVTNVPVTGLTADDFLIANGNAAGLSKLTASSGGGEVYIIGVTPASPGALAISLPAGRCTDALGQANTASSVLRTSLVLPAPSNSLREAVYAGDNFETLYYSLSGLPERRWPAGSSPGYPGNGGYLPALNDYFSVRWTGKVVPAYSESYTFYLNHDDGARLWINDILVYDAWSVMGIRWLQESIPVTFAANREYNIKLEYREKTGDGELFLFWQSPSQALGLVSSSGAFRNAAAAGGDTAPPTLTITGPATVLPGNDRITGPYATGTITITPSEPVTGLDLSDLVFTGCSPNVPGGNPFPVLGGPAADGTYSLMINATSASFSVSIPSGRCVDAANNQNTASNVYTGIRLSGINLTAPAAAAADFVVEAFNTGNTVYTEADFIVTNGTAISVTGGATGGSGGVTFGYNYITIRPRASGLVTVALSGSVAGLPANVIFSNNVTSTNYTPPAGDTISPTILLSGPSGTVTDQPDPTGKTLFRITVTPSEPITGLTASDFVVTGCSTDASTGANPATGEIPRQPDGTYILVMSAVFTPGITISLPAGRCTDIAGNANIVSNVLTTAIRPVLTLTTSPAELTSQLATPPGDFLVHLASPYNIGDILPSSFVVTNGSLVSWTFEYGSRYSIGWVAKIRPAASGIVTVSLSAGALKASGGGPGSLASNVISVNYAPGGRPNGVTAKFFSDTGLVNEVMATVLPNLNADWASGSPGPAVPRDQFSARFTGCIVPPVTGAMTLYLRADDGVRLWLNGVLAFDHWNGDNGEWSAPLAATAGVPVAIKIEYREGWGGASLGASWSGPGLTKQIIPSSRWLVNESGQTIPILIPVEEDTAAADSQTPAGFLSAVAGIKEIGQTLAIQEEGGVCSLSWTVPVGVVDYLVLEESRDLKTWTPAGLSNLNKKQGAISGSIDFSLTTPIQSEGCHFYRLRAVNPGS